jgi:hypothetical protein
VQAQISKIGYPGARINFEDHLLAPPALGTRGLKSKPFASSHSPSQRPARVPSRAISCTSITILRRSSALSICMNAPISFKPFGSETKSSTWAIDNALLWEPCGADAFGTPSKKKATGTCRMREICCNRLAEMRLVPTSFFCTCCRVHRRVPTGSLLASCGAFAPGRRRGGRWGSLPSSRQLSPWPTAREKV